MKILVLVAVLSGSAIGVHGQKAVVSLADMSPMAGCWEQRNEAKKRVISESWMLPGGTAILGMSRTVLEGKTAGWEYMRIEQLDTGLVFFSKPKENAGETAFALIRSTADSVVFENKAHDFPQRVIYTFSHDRLTGRIEGDDKGKPVAIDFPMNREMFMRTLPISKIGWMIAMMIAMAVSSAIHASPLPNTPRCIPAAFIADTYYRTELYFGRSIPGGGMVSDEEWEKFLAKVVTPRFPDGFTILKATGQYREENGTIDKEPSEVLLFFYPTRTKTASRRKIEIRRAYVKQFKQESVLRLDYPSTVNVLFK